MLGAPIAAGTAPHLLSAHRQEPSSSSPSSPDTVRRFSASSPRPAMSGPQIITSDYSSDEGSRNEYAKSLHTQANGHLMADYTFPAHRLRTMLKDPSKTPLVLVACGSFSPITYLHLRMFEMAADYIKRETNFELVGEYLSPVADAYKKKGLESASHRIKMCELAAETTDRLMVDPWEANQVHYTRTAVVLDRFDHELNTVRQGVAVQTSSGEIERRKVRIALLAGADLIGTMSTPDVWSQSDLDHILGQYGAFIVERSGTDMDEALAQLQKWRENIYIIEQLIKNDVSSTKIRAFLKKDLSVRYLIPPRVIQYIEEHGLYDEDGIRPHSRSRSQEQKPEEK